MFFDPREEMLGELLAEQIASRGNRKAKRRPAEPIIRDTDEGVMLTLSKGLDYDPFFDVTLARRQSPSEAPLFDRVKAALDIDPFWGVSTESEE